MTAKTDTTTTRAQLQAALDDPDPANPLAHAIADAIRVYADELSRQANAANGIPDPFRIERPANHVEAFALEVFTADLIAVGLHVEFKTAS